MTGELYIGDNLDFLNTTDKVFDLVYFDPPYNTGNTFRYADRVGKNEWIESIRVRIQSAKKRSKEGAPFIFSIAEDTLFDLVPLLKENFETVAPPFVWQTKQEGNNNKVNNVMSVCHEYLLVASDGKLVSNSEYKAPDEGKISRYPYGVRLNRMLDQYPEVAISGKKVVCIPPEEWSLEKNAVGFKGHRYQKRTAQQGHGSARYISLVKQLPGYSPDTLYFIKGVKDKNGLGGKFILGNSYFQSIGDTYTQKIPSFLGCYQAGIPGFQTAKPIDLMTRFFKAFSSPGQILLDMFCGSGNASIAAHHAGLDFVTCERGLIDEREMGLFAKSRLSCYLGGTKCL